MKKILEELGVGFDNHGAHIGSWLKTEGATLECFNPATEEILAQVKQATSADYNHVVARAHQAFLEWRLVPAPRRGELVRLCCNRLRQHKEPLGKLVSLEMGKILSEGLGEVQEMIDIGDFAVGLSRQLYGLSMHSERPQHRMLEQWHPLGAVGVITAFNFPVAVWAWNAMIALVCGDTVVWKPSSKTPLCAIAVTSILADVCQQFGYPDIIGLVIGPGRDIGEKMLADERLPLISATGSCRMGRHVSTKVASRFGRSILELGGNNGIIVLDDADLEMTVRAILFGALGTAGQRCTTTRRIIAQKGIANQLIQRLMELYDRVSIGDPLDARTLVGPLIDQQAVDGMENALQAASQQGAEIVYPGGPIDGAGYFVKPAIVKAPPGLPIMQEETFAPILYIVEVDDCQQAIAVHNEVRQGLSSAVFTNDIRQAQTFLSCEGSDCGIANVNIGTSGAEIGGAFGGEKETGGGREAGSDSWKAYMRRQTVTMNYSSELPLAQGVEFDLK